MRIRSCPAVGSLHDVEAIHFQGSPSNGMDSRRHVVDGCLKMAAKRVGEAFVPSLRGPKDLRMGCLKDARGFHGKHRSWSSRWSRPLQVRLLPRAYKANCWESSCWCPSALPEVNLRSTSMYYKSLINYILTNKLLIILVITTVKLYNAFHAHS